MNHDDPFSRENLPPDIKEAIDRYVTHRVLPGGFLTAVLENNLKEAVGRADDDNLLALPAIVGCVYNDIPAICQGSPEKVRTWLTRQEGRAEV